MQIIADLMTRFYGVPLVVLTAGLLVLATLLMILKMKKRHPRKSGGKPSGARKQPAPDKPAPASGSVPRGLMKTLAKLPPSHLPLYPVADNRPGLVAAVSDDASAISIADTIPADPGPTLDEAILMEQPEPAAAEPEAASPEVAIEPAIFDGGSPSPAGGADPDQAGNPLSAEARLRWKNCASAAGLTDTDDQFWFCSHLAMASFNSSFSSHPSQQTLPSRSSNALASSGRLRVRKSSPMYSSAPLWSGSSDSALR
jgi:hypothetical protein